MDWLLTYTHIHQQQIFIRWKIPRVGSKESGDNRQALLHRGEEALLVVEMGTYDIEGQGLLLNFGHPGSSSCCHSVSPVLAWKGLQWASSTWLAVLPVLAELWTFLWSLLQCAEEKKKKIRGNYYRVTQICPASEKDPSASSVENDLDSTNFYCVATMYQTYIRYQGFKVELDFLPALSTFPYLCSV